MQLFNERSKIILVEDSNGGFQLVDVFKISLNSLNYSNNNNNNNNNIYSPLLNCEDPRITKIIIPIVLVNKFSLKKVSIFSQQIYFTSKYFEIFNIKLAYRFKESLTYIYFK